MSEKYVHLYHLEEQENGVHIAPHKDGCTDDGDEKARRLEKHVSNTRGPGT